MNFMEPGDVFIHCETETAATRKLDMSWELMVVVMCQLPHDSKWVVLALLSEATQEQRG